MIELPSKPPTQEPTSMICPFCSLLCDSSQSLADCTLRNNRLKEFKTRPFNPRDEYEAELKKGRKWIEACPSIMVAGRITSVDSSRAILDFAKRTKAVVDGSDSEGTMDVATAISRTGACTVSLAEARELSDVFVVLGDDQLVDKFPQLACRLTKKNRNPSVVLLGQHSDNSQKLWQETFPNTWSVDCEIARIPEALDSFFTLHPNPPIVERHSTEEQSNGNALIPAQHPLIGKLLNANYISLIWSPRSLDSHFSELGGRASWVERLFEHQVRWNEKRRVGMLTLSGQDAVFQQVCLWTTGYPGRISFLSDSIEFEPAGNSLRRWFDDNRTNSNSLFIECNESADPTNEWIDELAADFSGRKILVTTSRPLKVHEESESIHLPTQIAGLDRTADMLGADQVVLAHILGVNQQTNSTTRSIAQWLEALSK